MSYDDDNIFARILRGEIPVRKIGENDAALAFHDAFPKAPVHVLVIPKGRYVTFADFCSGASDAEITGFYRLVAQVFDELTLQENGFRAIANAGVHGGQEVPHFHLHLVGGKKLGPMLSE